MHFRQHEFQAYIHSLKKGRKKTSRKTVWLFILFATLAAAYFGLRLTPCSSSLPPDQGPDPDRACMVPPPAVGEAPDTAAADVKPAVQDVCNQDYDRALKRRTCSVSRGDTMISLLLDSGIQRPEAFAIIKSLESVFDPESLREGQKLKLDFIKHPVFRPEFQRLTLNLDERRQVQVTREQAEIFEARETCRSLKTRPGRAEGTIRSSLYQAAKDSGLPMKTLMRMMRAYSFDVDFQRDINPGDSFQVLYEEKVNDEGEFVEGGQILYASLETMGRTLKIYRYEIKDGNSCLFDARGESIRKALMVTPVDGARISSGFGMRRHPILGYNKMHKGLDFAAPAGTPIMAAGDGIVEAAGPRGSYGNYIRIRHPGKYQTVYAHLCSFKKGIKSGTRVRQGETIGYIGSTGRSTGPHLHFEVRYRGKAVNPSTVKTPPGRVLEGEELAGFLHRKAGLERLYASLADGRKLASANSTDEDKQHALQ